MNSFMDNLREDNEYSNREDFLMPNDSVTFANECGMCGETFTVGAVSIDSIIDHRKINITLFRKKELHVCQTTSKNLRS